MKIITDIIVKIDEISKYLPSMKMFKKTRKKFTKC